MNKFLAPDPSEFKKLEKERVIKELEKAIKKAEAEERKEDAKKLKKELEDLTDESFLQKLFKVNIMY